MLKHLSRQHCLVSVRSRIVIPRRYNATDNFTTFDSLITTLITSVNLKEIPLTLTQALEGKTLRYIEHEKLVNLEKKLGTYNKDSFLNVFEDDNTLLVSEVLTLVKQKHIYNKDYKIKRDRYLVKRLEPPLKDYAIFLKYIDEEHLDISLIKRFYHRLPHPQPLYIKPADFERFMQIVIDTDDTEFYIQVLSDLKDANCDLTSRERSKMISNVFKIGHSLPMDIYLFLKSKIEFNEIELFNSVLKYCDHTDDNSKLFTFVLQDISNAKLLPNYETFRLMVRHFANSTDLKELNLLLNYLQSDSSFTYDVLFINTLIATCFQFERHESAYNLLQWLLQLTALKPKLDTNLQSVEFLKQNAEVLNFYNEALGIETKLEYLPNFDEQTAHICLKESFKRAQIEQNIRGIFEILDTLDQCNLVLWETSYKTIFAILCDLNPAFFTLSEVKAITKRFLTSNEAKLPYLLSNPVLRTSILDLFIKKSPNLEYTDEIQDKQQYMRELFEEFYRKYPRGFQSTDSRKVGSSKLHEVIMTSIISEFQDLVE